MDLNYNYTKQIMSGYNIQNEKILNLNKKILISIIILIVFRPHFMFIPDTISVYWPDLIIFTISIMYLISARYTIRKVFFLPELIVLISIFIPITASLFFNGFTFDLISAYLKIVFYYIVFLTLYDLIKNTSNAFGEIEKILYYSLLANFIVSLIQLFAVPMLFDLTSMIFGNEKLRVIWSGYPRVYGAFYNANWFGVYLIFMLAWLNERLIHKRIPLNKYMFNIVIIIFMLVITGSRTAVMAATVTLLFQFLRKNKLKNILLLLFMFIPFSSMILSVISRVELLERTLRRFTSVIDGIAINGFSFQLIAGSRWPEWINAYNRFLESPWVGSEISSFIPHNSYLSLLLRFGLIGFPLILLLIILIIIRLGSMKRMKGTDSYFAITSLGFNWGFLFVMLAGDYIFATQVMLLLILCAAIKYAHFSMDFPYRT